MIFPETLEDNIQKTDRKLKELALRMEQLESEHQRLLEEMGLTIGSNLPEAEELPPDTRALLENEKKKMQEQLSLMLHTVDPLQTKKCLSEQAGIQSHWLFVR